MGCKRVSQSLVATAALFDAVLGAALLAGAIYSLATGWRHIVPDVILYASLGVAVAIVLCACTGLAGACGCCPKRQKALLLVFAAFTLLSLGGAAVLTAFSWEAQRALHSASNKNWESVDGWEAVAGQSLRAAVKGAWDECDADVEPRQAHLPPGQPVQYHLECDNGSGTFNALEDAVNANCFNDPIDGAVVGARGGAYYDCYASGAWWAPPAPYTTFDASIDTPKGVFCLCHDAIVDRLGSYLEIFKWVRSHPQPRDRVRTHSSDLGLCLDAASLRCCAAQVALGVSIIYALVLLACVLLACRGKDSSARDAQDIVLYDGDHEKKAFHGAYFTRP